MLENKGNRTRAEQVLAALTRLGIQPTIQESRWPQITNIVVDFSPLPRGKRLVFSAHYDAVKNSPGANDNASGVAVLLGLCQALKHTEAPVKIIFFDREEAWLRTPVLRLGLLGSLCYCFRNDLRNIAMAYNLEFCGMGNFLGIWPVKGHEAGLPVIKQVMTAASRLSLPFKLTHIPWVFLSSDHLSFRLKGVSNSVSLTLLPKSQVPVMERLLESLTIMKVLKGQVPPLPEPLSYIHTPDDTSSRLSEDSLRLMLSLTLELSRSYRPQEIPFLPQA